jgi:hypothetical protein
MDILMTEINETFFVEKIREQYRYKGGSMTMST